MQIELFEVIGGWGYQLLTDDDVVVTRQEFDPNSDGRQLMDRDTAQSRAVAAVNGQGLAVTVKPRHISRLKFLQRMTMTERAAIQQAQLTDPVVSDFMFMFQQAEFIDLDEPTNRQALMYFVFKGYIQATRVEQLLE